MTTAIASGPAAKSAPAAVRFGDFILGRRIEETSGGDPARREVAAVAAGAAGTRYAGLGAVARCGPLGAAGAADVAERTARLRTVDHPGLVPILDAGLAGSIVYVIQDEGDGAQSAEAAFGTGTHTPATVARMVTAVAGGLQALHDAGFAHGNVTLAAVTISADGRARLGGLRIASVVARLTEETKAADIRALAIVAARALSGDPADNRTGVAELPGVPGAIVEVIGRAAAGGPGPRFASATAFAEAFARSIEDAGSDLIAGLWETLARNDRSMAAIMLEKARLYAPNHPDLPLLQARAAGGDGAALASWMPGLVPAVAGGPAAMPIGDAVPETSLEREQAIAALLRPPDLTLVAKPKNNPWVVFMAGVFGCILLMVVVAAVVFAYS